MRDRYTFLRAEPQPASEERRAVAPMTGAGIRAAVAPATNDRVVPPATPWRRRTSGPTPSRSTRPPVPLALYRLLDTAAPLAALVAALVLTNLGDMPRGLENFLAVRVSLKNVLLVMGLLALWRLACAGWGLYDWHRIRDARHQTTRVLGTCLTVAPFTLAFPATSVSGAFSLGTLAAFWLATAAGMLGPRTLLSLLARARRRPERSVLIAGTGQRAMAIEQQLLADPDVDYRVVGFADSMPAAMAGALEGRVVTDLDLLEGVLMHHPIDEVVVALPLKSHYTVIERLVRTCETLGVRVTLPVDPCRPARASFRPSETGSLLAVTLSDAPEGFRLVVKRWIDLVGASVALMLCAPLMLLVAAAVKTTSAGPVLFTQERYGFNRRLFRMYKFRTMVVGAEAQQDALESLNEAPGPLFKIRRDPRLTPVGAFLRRTSIDELPQLFNVLRGEMSLVGPRPMSVRDVFRLSEATLTRRFSVQPGMTGLWQVQGRSVLPYDAWATLDLQYVSNWSLTLDLKILALTIPAVLRGTGAE